MKLPAKIKYACNAVLELSFHFNGKKPVPVEVISKSQKIPKEFLIQLLLRLKAAGIVESSRGIRGGYTLAKPPAQLTLADIFRAVDSQILSVRKNSKSLTSSDSNDLISGIWEDINQELAQRLMITFEDLKSKIKTGAVNYSI
ncbi:MAG TPA: Rrf2 family transcriptional regulator [Candidatus Omnitrophota bacterium]|nr:Rrf2 family transcriptional regulator [Candidatus Omnitrophota bacterium]